MTSHVGRLYALAASVLGLFLAWAGVTAAPWPAKAQPAAQTQDPRRLRSSPPTSSACARTAASSAGSSSAGTRSLRRPPRRSAS